MTEWKRFCDGARDVQVEADDVVVALGRGRQHRLQVRPTPDALELSGIVARRAVADRIEDSSLAAWQRNRASSVAGFRIDDRGRLVGEAWVPLAGLTREDFLFYARSLAVACDSFEFQLTGRDRE